MLASEIVDIIGKANVIDKNVFNFFDKYKPYEHFFVIKKGPLTLNGNDLIDRDTLIQYIEDPEKPEYKMSLLPIYDEIKYRMTWKDISSIYTSTQTMYDCERFDLTNAKVVSENVVSILDRETGELTYFASDQTNTLVQYNYNEKGPVINPKTGVVEQVLINQGKDRYGTEKHRNAMTYRD